MSAAVWAAEHVGVTLEYRGVNATVVAAQGSRVVLVDEDGERMKVLAEAVMRAYVAQFGGMN